MLFNRLNYSEKSIFPLTPIQLKAREEVKQKVKKGYYVFQDVDCLICESKDAKYLARRDRYGLKYSVQICRECGFIYTSPRMTQSSYNEFYRLEYRKLYLGAEKPFSGYFEKQYNRGEAIYKYLKSLDLLSTKEQKVLEVGCSSGGILSYFKEKGFDTIGVDLDKDYLEYGRKKYGLKLIHGTIQDLPDGFQPDIIIYSHVLEHILDLDFELNTISKIIKPSTKIYIEVPGVKNIHMAYGYDLLRYLQNAHTFHFSLKSLTNLMAKYGFEPLQGDEFIKSVFQVVEPEKEVLKSDYYDVIKYLRDTERKRIIRSLYYGTIYRNLRHKLGKLIDYLYR